jgi:hypothetical protein
MNGFFSDIGNISSSVVNTLGYSVVLDSKRKQPIAVEVPVAKPISVAIKVASPVVVPTQVAAPEPSEPENPISNIKEINFSFSDSLENILRNTDNLQTINSAMKADPLDVAIDLLIYIYVNKARAIYFYNFNLKDGYDIDLIINVIYNNDFKKTLNIKLSQLATFYNSDNYNNNQDEELLITILEYFKRVVMGGYNLNFFSNKNKLYKNFISNYKGKDIKVSFIPHLDGGKHKTRKNKKSKKSTKKNKSKKRKTLKR